MIPSSYLLRTARLGMRQYTLADVEQLREIFATPMQLSFIPPCKKLKRWSAGLNGV
ncbi:MAG: hypothetical protein K1X48_01470 [Burkholderiaceae bacterium]|nr:hypothetical protein [Burkholderiaceae bacterium]